MNNKLISLVIFLLFIFACRSSERELLSPGSDSSASSSSLSASSSTSSVSSSASSTSPGSLLIQAEDYTSMGGPDGVQLENGGTTVGFIDDGDWMYYTAVDLGAGFRSVSISAAKLGTGGVIELRLDSTNGILLAVFTPENTGGWTVFTEQETNISNIGGVHDLYLLADGGAGVCNLDWLRFQTNEVDYLDWVLLWADEFNGADGSLPDTATWTAQDMFNPHNGEQQFYTSRIRNVQVSNGNLLLTAFRETYTNGTNVYNYTAGRIKSQGKRAFSPPAGGSLSIRARMIMPTGQGYWPALWMLGVNVDSSEPWPLCGELDITEVAANAPTITGGTTHYTSNSSWYYKANMFDAGVDLGLGYHVYRVDWKSDGTVTFYLDNVKMASNPDVSDNDAFAAGNEFFFYINVAVGGTMGGDPALGTFPKSIQVDWLRIYQDLP